MRWGGGDPFSLTSHRRGQRVVEKRRHGVDGMPMDDAVQPEVSWTGQEECGRYGLISSKCSSRVGKLALAWRKRQQSSSLVQQLLIYCIIVAQTP